MGDTQMSFGNNFLSEIASSAPDLRAGDIGEITSSRKISDARQAISSAITRHSIELADPREAFEFKSWTTKFSSTTITDFIYSSSSDLRISVSPDERDCYFIIIPIVGKALARVDGQLMQMTPNTAFIFGPTGGLDFVDSPPLWRNLNIRLNRRRFEDYVATHTRSVPRSELEFQTRPVCLLSEGSALLRFLYFLLNESTLSRSIFDNECIARSLENSLFGITLESMAYVDQSILNDGNANGRLSKLVLNAERFIKSNLREELDISTIADRLNVKPRTLHNAFKTHRSYTPLQYLKSCRLHHARDMLGSSNPYETSVTEVAMDVGFTHLSKFAAAYKAQFGESPNVTLRMVPGQSNEEYLHL